MGRWSRSSLRNFGVAAVVVLAGALVAVPVASSSAAVVPGAPAATAAADRITTFARPQGRSAFAFEAAGGDRNVPYSFVSTGGNVHVRRLGGGGPALTAATGAPVRPAATVKAAATYHTTLTVDSDNWSAAGKTMNLWNRDTWTYYPVNSPASSLSATADLPPGNYYVTAIYGIYEYDSYLLTKAFTVTNAAQTVHLPESSAKEVAIRTDDSTAKRYESAVWMSLPNGDLVGFGGGPLAKTYVTTASIPGTTLRIHDVLTKGGSTALTPSPYRYDLTRSWPHPLPASPIATVKTASLAKTTTTILGQGTNADGWYQSVPMTGEWTGVYLPTPVRMPATFTEYVTPGVSMARLVDYDSQATQWLTLNDRSLPAGTSPSETVGAGPLVPGRGDSRRDGNQLQLSEAWTLNDAADNVGTDRGASNVLTLSSGGQQLATTTHSSLSVAVPQAQQNYQLTQTSTRKVPWSQLSTKVSSEWAFASDGSAAGPLPLIDLAMKATNLDQRNRAGSAPVLLSVTPSTRAATATSTVDKIEWSTDDGATWAELPITASGTAAQVSAAVPATAAYVSLRVTASNNQGGSLRRTVIRALAGPATPGDDAVGGTRIAKLVINDRAPLIVGTPVSDGYPMAITAIFTVTSPSGVASAGAALWHGAYNSPDVRIGSDAICSAMLVSTSICSVTLYFWDTRSTLSSNALAGNWQVEVWAAGRNGTSYADTHAVGTLPVKQATGLTVDATPEPVTKGKTITVVGTLTRANWLSWTFTPYAARTVTLQYAKPGGAWTNVKTATTDASGKLKTTVTAGADGSYRWTFAGDTASGAATSGSDYVDVK